MPVDASKKRFKIMLQKKNMFVLKKYSGLPPLETIDKRRNRSIDKRCKVTRSSGVVNVVKITFRDPE